MRESAVAGENARVRIAVVGAGIGGLTAAVALSRDGHEVDVLEQAAAFTPVGAGIILSPNAAAVLDSVGVDLTGAGAPFTRFEVRDGAGTLLTSFSTAGAGPAAAMLRPVLHERLAAAVPAAVRVRLQLRVHEVAEAPTGVRVSGDDGFRGEYDLLVGADGLRSRVREQVYEAVPLRHSGQTCWRWTADHRLDARAVEWWAPGRRVGAVPLPDGRAYLYLVADAPDDAPAPPGVQDLVAGFDAVPAAAPLLRTLTRVPELHHDLVELDRAVWGRGRIVLLGDAAHAMTPNLGQGAAMAIEDAAALALVLRAGPDGVSGRYRRMRARRVRGIQLQSRRIGRISHWAGRPAIDARDAALRSVPAAVGRMRYRGIVRPGLRLARRLGTPGPGA